LQFPGEFGKSFLDPLLALYGLLQQLNSDFAVTLTSKVGYAGYLPLI
jgi:hypothetical protein